jgi:aminoglycoside 3-N-acetyltransferase
MTSINLFRRTDGTWLTDSELLDALVAVGASDCELLYVHSGMLFGVPNPDLSRREILQALFRVLRSTNVPTIVMPTFTFSFCNGTPFDREHSKSLMGALNEFVRTNGSAARSDDPLMSVVVTGPDCSLIEDLPPASLGAGSTFHRIHERGSRARFLFLGVNPASCFTYTHFVEKQLQVPYRYDRTFTGSVIRDGVETVEQWILFVRYAGVEPARSNRFVDFMRAQGALRVAPAGNSIVSSIGESDAYALMVDRIQHDIDYFLEMPHPRGREDRTFTARDMVAL